MTVTQWLFEYHALKKMEDETYIRNTKTLKHMLINLLGLNMLRPTHDNGVPKEFDEMTDKEKESYTPLTLWVCRREMLDSIKEQSDTAKAIGESFNDEEYEKLVSEIDKAGGDMEPILEPIFGPSIAPNATSGTSTTPKCIDGYYDNGNIVQSNIDSKDI